MGDSVVFWYPENESHSCGYCRNETGSISHGMWAKTLTVEDYQNLIDRGWRRSGCYCYKPIMNQTCCPLYTIKCNVLNFQLSKSQKRVIKKFNKFLKDGELNKSDNQQGQDYCDGDGVNHFCQAAPKQLDKPLNFDLTELENDETACDNQTQCSSQPELIPETKIVEAPIVVPKTGIGADPTKPPCKKAKVLRMERKKEKLLKRGMSLEKLVTENGAKTLEQFLNDAPTDTKHKFKLELINTNCNNKDWEKYKSVEFALYKKYQTSVHNDPPEKCTMDSFLRFLVNSPLQYVPVDGDIGFGSFHQLYWLDDKLIAVGVIDILPKCVSAVYFFYDPDYRDLTLGTYGSLREVEFARTLHQTIPSLESYYMGFYIYSCPKMRYKGKLTPSFLLCPETYCWIPIEKCLVKLEQSKYSRLDEDRTKIDDNACSSKDIDQIKTVHNRKLVLFKQYKKKFGGQVLFNTIGNLIGRKCVKTLIIFTDY